MAIIFGRIKTNIKVSLWEGGEKAQENGMAQMVNSLKESTKKIKGMAMVCINGQMVTFTKDSSKMIIGTDWERWAGPMEKHIWEDGNKDFSMVKGK